MRMGISPLYLLFAASVLADCNRFITTDTWTVKLNSDTGYSFLANASIQISNFTTCTPSLVSVPSSCIGRCSIIGSGGVSVAARFNITPSTNDPSTLSRFFTVAVAAAANKDTTTNSRRGPNDEDPPSYSVCGDISTSYAAAGIPVPEMCFSLNETRWVRYDPQFLCLNGTADECSNGPFENGTAVTVCGIRRIADGTISFLQDRTVLSGDGQYTATDENPSASMNMSMCQPSGVSRAKSEGGWMVAIAVIAGIIVGYLQ
ncbi:hypothetical protein Dda_8528 [Drechslerella dactyloides]|uniref:Uncharacterized protein n=1 Tax=Drechslerella dactyloides TaxID=74499 RepID=A0AAD6IQN4_DREDA|nr:hypothetical protein Dda_8528 [Drechslerella dactyloides]